MHKVRYISQEGKWQKMRGMVCIIFYCTLSLSLSNCRVNEQDSFGKTPLHKAAEEGSNEYVDVQGTFPGLYFCNNYNNILILYLWVIYRKPFFLS